MKCPQCGRPAHNLLSYKAHLNFCQRPFDEAAFWSKVERLPWSGCWIWMGAMGDRYGAAVWTSENNRRPVIGTHRIAWMLANGPIPKGMNVLHRCDTPLCVRPDHLFLGDQKINAADRIAKGRIGNRYQPIETLYHPHLSKRGRMGKDSFVS